MPDTVSWFVTFGLGTPRGKSYTEIRVPADLTLQQQEETARHTAFLHYGRDWAFIYPPAQFYDAVEKYGLTLHETLTAREPFTLGE